MTAQRILVIGASGAGTSTLGRGLADRLASQHFDIDDFFWYPSDPPFSQRRPIEERRALMQAMFLPRSDWVLSGSPVGWDEEIISRLTHVIFVTLDPGERLARLAARERLRYGTRISPGGDREYAYRAFMKWAEGYDEPSFPQRSRCVHTAWLSEQDCPILRLDAEAPRPALVAEALCWLGRQDALDRETAAAAALGQGDLRSEAAPAPHTGAFAGGG